MRPRLFFLFAAFIFLMAIFTFSEPVGYAQGGTCCDSRWRLPLLAGKWLITQGDRDSCVRSHCAGSGVFNEYAIDIVSASETTIKTMGAPVLAPADGTVLDEFWDGYGGGWVLKIEHGMGGPVTVYFHLSEYLVGKNATVKQGDWVARIGNSTNEDHKNMGPHLHVLVIKSRTERSGLKILSWDGNTNFTTGAIITSTNGSGAVSATQAPPPARPILSSPANGANMVQGTDVTLRWNSAANATQYKVELWGGPYSTMTPCDWQSGTSCHIGTMWPGTVSWHVKARNANGQESDWSETWTFTVQGPTEAPPTKTSTPPPQVPGIPRLRDPANGARYPQSQDIWFAWNYVSGADQYYLEYWGGPYGTLNSGWITDVAYHVGTMWPGTYHWHVKARNSSGVESNWSDTWSFVIQEIPQSTSTPIPPTAPPLAERPTLSSPANGSSWPQSTDITLVWNAAANATQYKVELWGGPYDKMTPCNWQSETTCHIGQMWPGTMFWHVKARNSSGQESEWSETWSFTIQDIPSPPTNTPPPSFTGNIAPQASRSPDGIGSGNAFDGNLSTFWTDGLGHRFTLTLSLPGAFDVSRILVWDRPQNSPDNQQINQLIISLSNGWSKRFDMISGGPRCIDVTLSPPQTITFVTLKADDASGNNGLSEVEIWVGPKTSGPSCSNSGTMP